MKKYALTRAARKRMYGPKHARQAFVIADNGRKIKCGTSKAEKEWLDRLGVPERSKVIIIFGKTYVLDGYDPLKKIAFEYNGLHAHGSHKLYPRNRDVKTWLGKTPNELYFGTINRYNILLQCGIKTYFVWEDDYKKGRSMGRFFRGPGDNLY